ncbi:hypothetical protein ACLB1R_09890 [Escherichia coli]
MKKTVFIPTLQMIQFVDHRLLLFARLVGLLILTEETGGQSRQDAWQARCHASVVTIVASWLVDLNLLVVSPWTLEASLQLHSKSASATSIAGLLIANFWV